MIAPRRLSVVLVTCTSVFSGSLWVSCTHAAPNRQAEMAKIKRMMEQQKQQMSKAAKKQFEEISKQVSRNPQLAKQAEEIRPKSRPAKPLPRFKANSSAALRPAVHFQNFLKVGRKATSMRQILPFLPAQQQAEYREEERQFDPELAKKQQELLGRSETFGTGLGKIVAKSPFERALGRYQMIAKRIVKYISTDRRGDQATLHVKVRNNLGTLSNATVGMVREVSDWKFAEYKQSLPETN